MLKTFMLVSATLFLTACQSTSKSNQTAQVAPPEPVVVEQCVPESYQDQRGDLSLNVNFDCSVNTMVLENLSSNEHLCSIYYGDMMVKSHLNAYEKVGFQLLSVDSKAEKDFYCSVVESKEQVILTKQNMADANDIALGEALSVYCDSDDAVGTDACDTVETVETVETNVVSEPSIEEEVVEDTI